MAVALAAKEDSFRVLAEGSSDMVTRVGLDELVHYASPSPSASWAGDPNSWWANPRWPVSIERICPRVAETIAALKRGETEEARITYRTRHREKFEIWIESMPLRA